MNFKNRIYFKEIFVVGSVNNIRKFSKKELNLIIMRGLIENTYYFSQPIKNYKEKLEDIILIEFYTKNACKEYTRHYIRKFVNFSFENNIYRILLRY